MKNSPLASVHIELRRIKRAALARAPKLLGRLDVDTAKVEFALGRGLVGSGSLYERVQELTCNTASFAYDAKKQRGAFSTPERCDGRYDVKVYRGGYFTLPNKIKGKCVGECPIPKGVRTLNLGDCGKTQLRVNIEGNHFSVLRFWWEEDNNTLWVTF